MNRFSNILKFKKLNYHKSIFTIQFLHCPTIVSGNFKLRKLKWHNEIAYRSKNDVNKKISMILMINLLFLFFEFIIIKVS